MQQFNHHIFLIGFMGTGKSTVAQYLSSHYGMEVVEMDQEIEEREKMNISEIFEKYGEEHFRKLETHLLLELRERKNLVISCGGGTALRDCNVKAMKGSGKVVFLTADPETILARVQDSHDRPLLENNKNVSFIASMMEQRRDKYEGAADVLVATDRRSVQEICMEIMEKLADIGFGCKLK